MKVTALVLGKYNHTTNNPAYYMSTITQELKESDILVNKNSAISITDNMIKLNSNLHLDFSVVDTSNSTTGTFYLVIRTPMQNDKQGQIVSINPQSDARSMTYSIDLQKDSQVFIQAYYYRDCDMTSEYVFKFSDI